MNSFRFFLLIVFTFVATQISFAQQMMFKNAKLSRERTMDVLHYRLEISVNEKEQSITGTMTARFVPLHNDFKIAEFDQEGLQFSSASVSGKPLRYFTEGKKVKIALDKSYSFKDTVTLSLSYSAKPKKGLYFVAPDASEKRNEWQVWSQGQSEENHWWFPCYDSPNDKATSEMLITVNDKLTAISNGKLLSEKNNSDGTKTFHYKISEPHSSYLISLIVGEFAVQRESYNGIPLEYFTSPAQQRLAQNSFSKTAAMFKFYTEKIGFSYPWEKYAQVTVADYLYGGMENTSVSTLTDNTLHDTRAEMDFTSDGLVSHEIVHQWWGNTVTCRDWSHAWLNEGFAAYFEQLWYEHERGVDDLTWGVLGLQRIALQADDAEKHPVVWNGYTDPEEVFGNHIYAKGGAVLHIIRKTLGDDLWWKALKHFIHKHQFENIETNDLKIAIEEATGYNLQPLFNQWLYRAGYPDFYLESSYDDDTKKFKLLVKQTQLADSLTGIFSLPVEIEFFTSSGSVIEKVFIDRKYKEFTFPLGEKPRAYVFDKGSTLIKRVNIERTADELIYLLRNGDLAARVDAIDELKRFLSTEESAKSTEALLLGLATDSFWGIRVNAAEALGTVIQNNDVQQQLLAALNDGNSKVRAAAIHSLEKIQTPNPSVISSLQNMFRNDSSYVVCAAALIALTTLDEDNAESYCEDGLTRDSHQEIIRTTALDGLVQIGGSENIKIVLEHTSPPHSTKVRAEAIGLLINADSDENAVVKQLSKLLNDPVAEIRRAAISALENFARNDVVAALKSRKNIETDNRVLRSLEQVIEALQEQLEPQTKG